MRILTCHPERKHFAKGLCASCYQEQYKLSRGWIRKYAKRGSGNNKPAQMATCHPERPQKARGLCSSCYYAEWNAANPQKRDSDKLSRRRRMFAKFGVPEGTPLECAICGNGHSGRSDSPHLAIDHDHRTGEFRGLLCQGCNLMLGHSGDSPERLEAAAAYLRQRSGL